MHEPVYLLHWRRRRTDQRLRRRGDASARAELAERAICRARAGGALRDRGEPIEDLMQVGHSQIHVSRIVREALETMQELAGPRAA